FDVVALFSDVYFYKNYLLLIPFRIGLEG
ncbi:MAG: hypothetical protein ACI81W_002695, partial [Saprospiraceae bacterium]